MKTAMVQIPEPRHGKHEWQKRVGVLTLLGVADLSQAERVELAEWLRRQAGYLEQAGPVYTPRYTARYWVGKEEDR